jgi:hypothetical protein
MRVVYMKDTRCKWSQLYSLRYILLIVTRFLVHVVVKASGFLAGKYQISAVVRREFQAVGVRADGQIGKRRQSVSQWVEAGRRAMLAMRCEARRA